MPVLEEEKKKPGLMNTVPAGGTTPVTTYQPAAAQAKEAKATGYDPTGFEVTPEQTVLGQVGKVTASDSPIIQQARRRADEFANQRGLMNSSLAAGWGEEAVIGAATPIAMADAATYERAGTNTVNAKNAAAAFKAGAENTASNLNASLGTDVSKANAGAENVALAQGADAALRQYLQTADNDTKRLLQSMSDAAALTRTQLTTENQLAIAKIDQGTKMELGKLDANNRQLLQTNATLSSMYQETVKNLAAIATNNTMTPEAKTAATATQLNSLNEALRTAQEVATTEQAAIKSLNLGKFFVASGGLMNDTSVNPAANTSGGVTVPGWTGPTVASVEEAQRRGLQPVGYMTYMDPNTGERYRVAG